MTHRIELALAKEKIIQLDQEQTRLFKIWSDAFDNKDPNAKYILNGYKGCGEIICALMKKYNLQPGVKLNWLDRLICLIW